MAAPLTIQFQRRLRGVVLHEPAPPSVYTEADIEAADQAGYQRGCDETAEMYEAKLREFQAEVLESQHQTLRSIAAHHESLAAQLSAALPGVAMEAVRRVIAATEIDRAMITAIVQELLAEIHPGADALEIVLSERDLGFFEGNEEAFRQNYPGIHFTSETGMRPGDCIVRNRYGVIDGRISTKLVNVEALLE